MMTPPTTAAIEAGDIHPDALRSGDFVWLIGDYEGSDSRLQARRTTSSCLLEILENDRDSGILRYYNHTKQKYNRKDMATIANSWTVTLCLSSKRATTATQEVERLQSLVYTLERKLATARRTLSD